MKYHEIKIEGNYETLVIYDLKVTEKFNEHGRLFLSGMLPKVDDHEVDVVTREKTIKIVYQPEYESEEQVTLFEGLIENVVVKETRAVCMLEIVGISHTALLDMKKRNHSFQNSAMTYTSVVSEILSKYDFRPLYLYPHESSDRPIGKFIAQIEETDWEFLMRVASMNHTFLLPESTYYKTAFWVGLPEGRRPQLIDGVTYQKQNNFEQLRHINANGLISNVRDDQFITYKIKAPHLHLKLGDRVTFQNQSMVVCQKESVLTPELAKIENQYTLCYLHGARFAERVNQKLKGRSFPGRVIDAKKGHTKIHLQIDSDRTQPKETAKWFVHAVDHAGGGDKGWNAAPEDSDTVWLYFSSNIEEDAYILTSNGADLDKLKQMATIPEIGHSHKRNFVI